MLSRRPSPRLNRGRIPTTGSPGSGGGGGGGGTAPASPTLTAPAANANVFNGMAATVSATTTDTNLDQMDWLLDGVVVATVLGVGTPAGTFSTTWTPSASDGTHTLTARATRGGQTATSAGITVNVGEVLHTLISSVTVLRAWQSDFGLHDDGSGKCDSWTDQKSGVAATQATSGKRPAIGVGVNGHPVLTGTNAASTVLSDATLNVPQPLGTNTFIWCVFVQTAWSAGASVFGFGTGGTMRLGDLTSTPNMALSLSANGNLSAAATLGTVVRAECLFTDTANDYLKLGNDTPAKTNLGNSDPAAGFSMGAFDTATANRSLDGSYYAFIVTIGQPSTAELSALSVAAAAMYGAAV